MALLTIKDFDLSGKTVLLRADINSPLDPRSGRILDSSRIRSYIPTLEMLSNSKAVLLAHQSRPGKSDFTTLVSHGELLGRLLKRRVSYVDDVFGSSAKREINKLENGDVLVLENVRLCSEEVSEEVCSKPPMEQAKTLLVRKLSSYVDFYVNDAFAVSHRAQPSIVAFPMVLPSCIGPTVENELKVLSEVINSKERPKIFSLGGAKADDTFLIVKNVISKGIADKVLLSGVASIISLIALDKDVGEANRILVKDLGYQGFVKDARRLLDKFEEKIKLPVDMAYENKGKRMESPVDGFPNKKALDIGTKTIESFSKEIKGARIIIAKGPSGVFEVNGFGEGTQALLEAVARSKALSVIGGGHFTTVANASGLRDKITHISSGGGATVSYLSGQLLPGLEAMKRAKVGAKQ